MSFRNSLGFTLPFALILTFIFSALVGVSFLFVSLNLRQMYSSLQSMQAIAVAEGINERVKARLNTKSKIQPSPQQEAKLASFEEDDEFEDEDDDFFEEEMFDETTDIYDEYYADEVIQISRFITFREPPNRFTEVEEGAEESTADRPEANVEMIGSISIPRGTVLQKGAMIVVYKDEKLNLELEDIVPEQNIAFRNKLPAPIIKSLSPNYAEANSRGSFTVIGENLSYDHKARFNNKNIVIEDIKAGPFVEYFINDKVKSGLTNFYWETARAEFYVIPPFDGSVSPVINEIKNTKNEPLLDVNAGQRGIVLKIYGADLFLNKSPPVVIPDVAGIVPKVKEYAPSGNEITVTLSIESKVEPGVHTLTVATEGGLSNTWLFNILPAEKSEEELTGKVATYTSSLTLLEVRAVQNLLPLIDEEDKPPPTSQEEADDVFDNEGGEDEDDLFEEEVPESEKLSPYANTDLETVWLLETSAMVGRLTKTVSETVQRVIPNINAGLVTNGKVTFSGGGFSIIGGVSAMTVLTEPTYISNTKLIVPGPPEEEEFQEQEQGSAPPPQSPLELGFTPGSLVAVYQEGQDINELDYATIKSVGEDTIELVPPGLMDFHYQGDVVYQFNPAVISGETISTDEAKKHIAPPGFQLKIPKAADFKKIFKATHSQFSELADFYSTDALVPQDEFGIPIGYMDLAYIEGTPTYDENDPLLGKGIVVVDTRIDNLGEPNGTVEINGNSRNPADFTGILYVHGNLMISGTVNINGAVIVDNGARGNVEISSEALGMIAYSDRAIRQVLLSVPFTTIPGTVMISNKPLNLGDYVQSGEKPVALGAAPTAPKEGEVREDEETKVASSEIELVEAEIKPKSPDKGKGITITDLFGPEAPPKGGKRKSAEEELIDLF